MMDKDESWMFVSIFYSKSEWSNLITSAIKPFVLDAIRNESLDKFAIYPSTYRGDHICLGLKARKGSFDTLASTTNYFHNFLKTHPSTAEKEDADEVPTWFLFKNFSNNSVHYNIHYDESIRVTKISHEIDAIVDEYLYETTKLLLEFVDEDSGFFKNNIHAALVLNLLYVALIFNSADKARTFFDFNYQHQLSAYKNPARVTAQLGELFTANKEELVNYFSDILRFPLQHERITDLKFKRWANASDHTICKLKHLLNQEAPSTSQVTKPLIYRVILREMNKIFNLELKNETTVLFFAKELLPIVPC